MRRSVAILHYSVPPVVGGVEEVILAHARLFLEAGYPVTIIAGRGEARTLPAGVDYIQVPEINNENEVIEATSLELEQGRVPDSFNALVDVIEKKLKPLLEGFDRVILHNVLSKHFNLPLTAALIRLVQQGVLRNSIAWCHDFSWTSPNSRKKVFPGFPWDLLRTYEPGITYVTVSESRRTEMADLFQISEDLIRMIYNGVDARQILCLSEAGSDLIERLGIFESDLALLMPVRLTRAKNVEFALHVAAEIKKSGKKLRMVLTGPPDPHDVKRMGYYQTIKELRKSLGVEEEMRFVYESGPDGEGYSIDNQIVAELYRVCDVVLMPSLREGFGIPVLEAGLLSIPIFCTNFPAAEEVGKEDIFLIEDDESPEETARRILAWAADDPRQRLRRKVRQEFTWRKIFEQDIQPIVNKENIA